MIDSWINQLAEPSHYSIGKVIAANVDVDIYESTVDSLFWLDKCEWLNNKVIVRFDDWSHPIAENVKFHNQLAYTEFISSNKYTSTLLYLDLHVAIFKIKK